MQSPNSKGKPRPSSWVILLLQLPLLLLLLHGGNAEEFPEEAFARIDVNGDSLISFEELQNAYAFPDQLSAGCVAVCRANRELSSLLHIAVPVALRNFRPVVGPSTVSPTTVIVLTLPSLPPRSFSPTHRIRFSMSCLIPLPRLPLYHSIELFDVDLDGHLDFVEFTEWHLDRFPGMLSVTVLPSSLSNGSATSTLEPLGPTPSPFVSGIEPTTAVPAEGAGGTYDSGLLGPATVPSTVPPGLLSPTFTAPTT